MTKIRKFLRLEFYIGIFYIALFLLLFPFCAYCYEPVKTVVITKEDIENATAQPIYKVEFTNKQLKSVEMMEKRHFDKTYRDLDDATRLLQLEYELLGRVWKYTDTSDRIRKLELVSMNRMLRGMAIPPCVSGKISASKINSDTINNDNDDVGLIDGFLRLLNPEKYNLYKTYSKRKYNKYDY